MYLRPIASILKKVLLYIYIFFSSTFIDRVSCVRDKSKRKNKNSII